MRVFGGPRRKHSPSSSNGQEPPLPAAAPREAAVGRAAAGLLQVAPLGPRRPSSPVDSPCMYQEAPPALPERPAPDAVAPRPAPPP